MQKYLITQFFGIWLACVALFGAIVDVPAAPLPPQKPFLRIETGEHAGAVRRIDSSADGTLVATIADDKTIRLWHMPSGEATGILRIPIAEGAEGKLYALAMAPDGNTLAVAGDTGTTWDANGRVSIYIFDIKTAKMLGRLQQPGYINALAYSPDGRYLAAVLGNSLGLLVFATANRYHLAFADDQYSGIGMAVAFAADGRLATAAFDGQIRLYSADLQLLATKNSPSGAKPYSLAFSPDGSLLAVGQFDTLAVDVMSGETLELLYSADTTGINSAGNLAAVAWTGTQADLALWAGGSATYTNQQRFLRRWGDAGRGQALDIPVSKTSINDLHTIHNVGLVFAHSDPGWGLMTDDGQRLILSHTLQAPDFRSLYDGRFAISADGTQVEFGVSYAGTDPFRFDVRRRTLVANPSVDSTLKPPVLAARKHTVTDWQDQTHPSLDGRNLQLKEGDISHSAAMNKTGTMLVIGGEYRLYLFKNAVVPVATRETPSAVWAVNLTQDGRTVVAALGDGTIRWYSLLPGHELELLGCLFVFPQQKLWIVWTPEGFFTHSANGGQNLVGFHLNNGSDNTPLFANFSQVYSALHRPDLVIAKLTGEASPNMPAAIKAAAVMVGNLRQRPVPRVYWLSYCPAPADAQLVGRAFKRSDAPAPNAVAQVETSSGNWATAECHTVNQATRGFARIAADAVPTANQEATVALTTTTQSTRVLVRFAVEDAGGGVGDVDLLQNGRLVYRISPEDLPAHRSGDRTVTLERVVDLQPGQNNLEIRASNADHAIAASPLLTINNAQPITAVADASASQNRLFLVAIGIDSYPAKPLSYAVADAKEVIHALRANSTKLFSDVQVLEIYDARANNQALQQSLQNDVLAQIRSGDTVVIYMSGHGITERDQYYFVTYDAVTHQADLRTENALSQSQLIKILGQIQAAKANVLLILDTCYAGGALNGFESERVSGDMENSAGIMVLAGSSGYQEALDSFANSGHSLLGYTLLRGLSGKYPVEEADKRVFAGDLARWAAYQATRDASKLASSKGKRVEFRQGKGEDFILLNLEVKPRL